MITISFTTLFLLFLFFFGWRNRIDFDMWDLTERSADIRQKELLSKAEKNIERLEKANKSSKNKTTRRAIKGRNGAVLVEEVILSGHFDDEYMVRDEFDDEDFIDDYDDDFGYDDDYDEEFYDD